MTLADFVTDVAKQRKTLVVYASDGAPDVAAHFESRNVTVERESLAPGGPDGFVVLGTRTASSVPSVSRNSPNSWTRRCSGRRT